MRGRILRSLTLHHRVAAIAAIMLAVTVAITTVMLPTRPKTLAASVAQKVDPSIVDIAARVDWEHADQVGTGTVLTSCQVLSGSGLVLSPSGEVLANNHAIEDASSITARDVGNGQNYVAKAVGYDRSDDLAVLQLHGASGLHSIPVARTPPRIGEKVFLVGNAGGGDGTPIVTGGRVTALVPSVVVGNEVYGTTETLKGVIESSANSASGDSGGALVNQAGRVIGIEAAGLLSSGCDSRSASGFAIPISRGLTVAHQVRTGHSSTSIHVGPTAYLGVEVVPPQSVLDGLPHSAVVLPPGAFITKVQPHSPAEQAHLSEGDEIVSLAGQAVDSPEELIDVLQSKTPGAVFTVGWIDLFGVRHTSSVRVGSGPPQ